MYVISFSILVVLVIFCIIQFNKNNSYHDSNHEQSYIRPPVPGTPEYKGIKGEFDTRAILTTLPDEDYIVLNDVLLPTKNRTTQLDHIVISVHGIFVIETKNYSGKLYGGRYSENWTQYIGGQEYQLYNPLLQNERHAQAVSQLIHVPSSSIIPLVVFVGSAEIKTNAKNNVVYLDDLYHTITGFQNVIFTHGQIKRLSQILDDAIDENNETKKAHLNAVADAKLWKKLELSVGNCPRCNGKLVLRHGKFGQFIGCSNYPGCRYTRNIKQ